MDKCGSNSHLIPPFFTIFYFKLYIYLYCMIKLKDLLYEMNLLIPRKLEGRMEKYVQLKIQQYKENNNVGDFSISGLGLTKLPASLKHLKIGGNFYCRNNGLEFLTNAPVTVGGSFNCSTNKLTSLAGAPTSVGLDFICSDNDLNTLTGGPVSVVGNFDCSSNKLKFLTGAPTSVGLDFNCNDNLLDTLLGAPNSVDGNFYCNNNSLTSLADAPVTVGGSFFCYNNRGLKFTKEQVRAVCDVTWGIYV